MLSDAKKLWQRAKNSILKKTNGKGIPPANAGNLDQGTAPKSTTSEESRDGSSTPSAFTWASRPVDKPKVRGFERQILSLRKLVGDRENDRQFKAVGVVGVRGVGKTALCQVQFYSDDLLITANEQTANDEKSTAAKIRRPESSFFPRAWMRVSNTTPNEEKVTPLLKIEQLKGALERLGVEGRISDSIKEEKMKVKALLYVLRRRLIGKKYLIVLDDVQNSNKWQENLSEATSFPIESGSHPESEASLACGLPKGSGGTVIITSRDEKTVKKMVKDGHRDIHCVLPLSDPESLFKIFEDAISVLSAKKNDEINTLVGRLEKITSSKQQLFGEKIDMLNTLRKKVLSKCNGLPLAARLTAETMLELLDQKEKELADKKKNGKDKESDVVGDGKVSREEEDKKVEDKDGSLCGQDGENVRENVIQDKMQEESVAENVEENIKDEAEKETEEGQSQEGKGSDSEVASQKIEDEYHKEEKETSGENKEENHPEEETVMKEEHEETAEKTGVKDTSREKEDRERKEEKETSGENKEENHPKEETVLKEEYEETAEKTGVKDTSREKEDCQDVETEKVPEKNKQVQGEEIMHDEKASIPKKEDDQKEKETEKDQVVPRKEEKEEEATEEVSQKSPQSKELAKVEEEVLEKKIELQEKPEEDAEENKSSTEEALPKKEE